jgi:hypothetical protein
MVRVCARQLRSCMVTLWCSVIGLAILAVIIVAPIVHTHQSVSNYVTKKSACHFVHTYKVRHTNVRVLCLHLQGWV